MPPTLKLDFQHLDPQAIGHLLTALRDEAANHGVRLVIREKFPPSDFFALQSKNCSLLWNVTSDSDQKV